MTTLIDSNASHLLGAMRCEWRLKCLRPLEAPMVRGLCLGLMVAVFTLHSAQAADAAAHWSAEVHAGTAPESAEAARGIRANFDREPASVDARQVADWVVDSGDNQRMPFVIVDKKTARVFVFQGDGRLKGAAPALLGLAVGDDSVPGIGTRKLSSIRPEERTTPAGRFVAAMDRNLHGGEILWVDYEGAVSLHPVITSNPREQRAQRLATPTPLDNRISYGCINVPAEFFKRVVSPAFTGTSGIVYVLPETRSAQAVFASYDVDERARLRSGTRRLAAQVIPQTDTR